MNPEDAANMMNSLPGPIIDPVDVAAAMIAPPLLTKEELERFRRQWLAQNAGGMNAHLTPIPGPVAPAPLAFAEVAKIECQPGKNYMFLIPAKWHVQPADLKVATEKLRVEMGVKMCFWTVPDPSAIRVIEVPEGVGFEEYLRKLSAENGA